MPIVKFRSNDGVDFGVDVELVNCSEFLKTMFQLLGCDDEVVPLPKVSAAILQKVIEWATYHRDHPLPNGFSEDNRLDNTPQWDVDFLKMGKTTLARLIEAANYLQIKDLLAVVAKTIAHHLASVRPLKNAEERFNKLNEDQDGVISEAIDIFFEKLP